MLSNITACQAVVDAVKTTLGPRGMDKLIVDAKGQATISNDGATILKLLDIVHPAARALVDLARAQDAEVGDGTTSVTILAGELLKQAKPFIEENVAPQLIIRAYRQAAEVLDARLMAIAVPMPEHNPAELRQLLERCARTALNSKVIHGQGELFARLAVQAVLALDPEDRDERLIGIKRVPGGAVEEAEFVDGVAFKKTFSYAGFEQQPKSFQSPAILCLNVELELKAERDNAEVRLEQVSEYQAVVDAEWTLLMDKLEACAATGAKVVLSQLPIGDVATQFFADRDIFCAGRVPAEDMQRVLRATGAHLQSSTASIQPALHLGHCATFEERQVGSERFNFFNGCPQARTCTLILRGGSEQFIAEVDRALHDAIMIAKRALAGDRFVAGGGAVEMELSRFLREEAKTRPSRDQLILAAYAKAFEALPRQLCDNAGLDATDLLTRLRKAHASSQLWAGLNLETESVVDTLAAHVWEPVLVKRNMIAAATEAACTVLSVDLTIRAAKPWDANAPSGLEQLEAKSHAAHAARHPRK